MNNSTHNHELIELPITWPFIFIKDITPITVMNITMQFQIRGETPTNPTRVSFRFRRHFARPVCTQLTVKTASVVVIFINEQ